MDKFNILIVDDIKENLYSLQLLIQENFDVNVLMAFSAQEAIEVLTENRIDLILTDIQMPEIDGFEFVQYLKDIKSLQYIPIIFITGIYDKDEYKNRGYDIGAIDYITKPIDNHLLTSKLKIYINVYNTIKESKQKLDKTQDLLIHNSKMASMGEMIGLISHQLKQPLNVLSLCFDEINMNYEFNEINDEFMEHFKKNTKKQINYMDATISDFLNFFNVNKRKEKFSIKETILRTQDILASKIKLANNTTFYLDLDDTLEISGVKSELLQVMINIINNSLDVFIEKQIEKPEIYIKLLKENGKILLSIEDNGGGIEENNLGKILEPYFTTKEKGIGVGLYMVKIIIENSFCGDLKLLNGEKGLKFLISLENN